MQPPVITSSNSDSPTLQNPIAVLPKELFTHLFNFLSSTDILDSSFTNREWRDTILSCSTLFTTLIIKSHKLSLEANLQNRAVAADMLLKRVLRYARLSHNRLKYVNLCIQWFDEDVGLCRMGAWEKTKLSIVFDILRFSSDSLKTLTLEFPHSKSDDSVVNNILHLMDIIETLKDFHSLQEIDLKAHTGIGLTSRAFESNCRLESWDLGGFDDEGGSEMIDGTSIYAELLRKVKSLNNSAIESISCQFGISLSSQGLIELQLSRDSLQEIMLELPCCLEEEEDDPIEDVSSLIFSCPNLVNLVLSRRRKSRDEVIEEQSFEFLVPQIGHVSKLERLALILDKSTGIVLDENFWEWVGSSGSLKEFMIGKLDDFEDENPERRIPLYTEYPLLTSFLKNSSTSLTQILLVGLGLSSVAMPVEIKFHKLQKLHLTGNNHLINLFAQIQYSSLQALVIQSIEESPSSDDVDHLGMLRIIESCQSTLEEIEIVSCCDEEKIPTHEESREATEHRTNPLQIGFTLTKVSSLDLALNDATISRFYLPIKYPNLKEVSLSRSSKLSESSFSSGAADLTINKVYD